MIEVNERNNVIFGFFYFGGFKELFLFVCELSIKGLFRKEGNLLFCSISFW